MLYNYIRVEKDNIVKATPRGYKVVELKKDLEWTSYSTNRFTNRYRPNAANIPIADFSITNSPRAYSNSHDVFVQEKSASVFNGTTEIFNAINIDSLWDKGFPETIRLKYPGVITNNNLSERKSLKEENNYTFRVWENRSNQPLSGVRVMPYEAIPTLSQQDYFYDLLSFIKSNGDVSYDEWLKRPLFSLKNLLTKGIYRPGSTADVQRAGRMYQLYKVNDVNVQSLSTSFDEYIPWCFDINGSKIDQHKIAVITSFNKKEIYLLMEIRPSDVAISGNNVIIPTIENIVFWRGSILDSSISMDVRNPDQKILVKDNNVSNISEYFRESKIETNTLVSFQKDRLENIFGDDTPVDNNDTPRNYYEFISNKDPFFQEIKTKELLGRSIFGKKTDNILNVPIGTKSFSDHAKSKVHIFVDGNLLTNDEFYIANGSVRATLPTSDSYVEIFINKYESVEYNFTLTNSVSLADITQDQLSHILYNNGFMWKTSHDKGFLLFNKSSNSSCKMVGVPTVTSGNYLVVHGLFFDMVDEEELPPELPPGTSSISVTNNADDVSDARDYNINYDPILFRTSKLNGSGPIKDKDVWIFDNTKNHLKLEDNEVYMVKDEENKIKVMGVTDRNIDLLANQSIKDLRSSLTKDYTGQGRIHNLIISEAEKNYLIKHYSQMSIINRNILNMFLHSGPTGWQNLSTNSTVNLTKDYMIVRYTGTGEFPLLRINKPYSYKYDGVTYNTIEVKVKPARVVNEYYVLHRPTTQFGDLYTFSFSKPVSYIIV